MCWRVSKCTKSSYSFFYLPSLQILSSRHKEKSVSSSQTSVRRSGWRRKSHRSDRDKYITTSENRSTRFQRKADPRTAVTVTDPPGPHSNSAYVHWWLRRASCQRNATTLHMLYILCADPSKVQASCFYLSLQSKCQHVYPIKLIFLERV